MTTAEESRLLRKLRGIVASVSPGKAGLTVREAAIVSGIGETELRRRIDADAIPVVRVGRRIIIPRTRLLAYLESLTATMQEHRDREAG